MDVYSPVTSFRFWHVLTHPQLAQAEVRTTSAPTSIGETHLSFLPSSSIANPALWYRAVRIQRSWPEMESSRMSEEPFNYALVVLVPPLASEKWWYIYPQMAIICLIFLMGKRSNLLIKNDPYFFQAGFPSKLSFSQSDRRRQAGGVGFPGGFTEISHYLEVMQKGSHCGSVGSCGQHHWLSIAYFVKPKDTKLSEHLGKSWKSACPEVLTLKFKPIY